MSFQHTSVVETGISDHHKMVQMVIKTTFLKASPKIIHYRNTPFKFDTGNLQYHLKRELFNVNDLHMNYETFEDMFSSKLSQHALLL